MIEWVATIVNVHPGKRDWCVIWMMPVHPIPAVHQTQSVKQVSSTDHTNAVVQLGTLDITAMRISTSVKKVRIWKYYDNSDIFWKKRKKVIVIIHSMFILRFSVWTWRYLCQHCWILQMWLQARIQRSTLRSEHQWVWIQSMPEWRNLYRWTGWLQVYLYAR